MRELSERDKARLVDGIPESALVFFAPGLQGHGATVRDRSKNANHGTISGPLWKRLPSGLWVHNYYVTGCWILVPHSSSFNVSALSIEVWIKPSGYGWEGSNSARIAAESSNAFILLYDSNGTLGLQLYAAGASSFSNPACITLNVWQKIEVGYDPADGHCRFFNNTVSVGAPAKTGAIAASSGDIHLGNVGNGDRTFQGLMWAPRITGRALTDAERAQRFNRERLYFGV